MGAVAVAVILFGLILRKQVSMPVAMVMMVLGLGWFGSFEWFRESLRKPFIVTDYMYANGLEVAKTDQYLQEGLLANMAYRTGDDGADLFRRACRSCHTLDGYKPLRPGLDGTDEEFIRMAMRGLHVMKGNMPPFLGTDEEAAVLAAYLHGKIDRRSLKDIYNLSGVSLGEKVYDLRCGKCHVFGGYKDKSASILNLSETEIMDLLQMSGDLAEEMPGFTGDSVEAAALVEFLQFKSHEAEGSAR
jgi:mono/diheme cytochrome c family protein